MHKILRRFVIINLIFSPLWVGAFATMDEPPDSVAGIAVFIGLVIGAPIIAVFGFVGSKLLRNSSYFDLFSLLCYFIPALAVCLYMILVML